MNKQEFTLRIAQRQAQLLRIARSMVRKSDCEDAVQSAVLSAWEHLPELKDESAFDAWLGKILINRCRQIQREYKKEKDIYAALPPDGENADAPDTVLQEAMDQLREDERTLIRMHHEQGYSIREIADAEGKAEDAVKMRLYRARKHLRTILITMLLLVLLTAVAAGTGLIDVNWLLQNRRAEPADIEKPIVPESVTIEHSGSLLDVSVSDAVWNAEELSLTFVYSIAGKDEQSLVVHGGNIGVDGMRMDHIWTDEGIVPVSQWANGKHVHVFALDGWRLGGMDLTGNADYLPDGLGETFMTEVYLDWINPQRYERLLDANGMLNFEAELMLKAYESGEILEAQTVVVGVSAPTLQEWREMYEAHYR